MPLKNYKKIVDSTPDDVKQLVRHSMDILDRIHELLQEKFQGKQKLLAEKLGKSEAEVSKWFSGTQNFTLKTISKLEVAFGEPIIGVKSNCEHTVFMEVKTHIGEAHTRMQVNTGGNVEEKEYKPAGLLRSKLVAQGS